MATAFDVIMLAITAVLLISGTLHGLIRSVCRFVALLTGFLVSWMYYRDLQAWLVSHTSSADGNSAAVMSFVAIFILVSLVVLQLGRLLVKILNDLELGWIDRLGGAALGLLKAGIVIWAACLSISSLPSHIFEAKFGTSVVFKIYDAMPDFFSLSSMENWRDSIRGVKREPKEAINANDNPGTDGKSSPGGGAKTGGEEQTDEFDSPLKQKMRQKNKGKTADI